MNMTNTITKYISEGLCVSLIGGWHTCVNHKLLLATAEATLVPLGELKPGYMCRISYSTRKCGTSLLSLQKRWSDVNYCRNSSYKLQAYWNIAWLLTTPFHCFTIYFSIASSNLNTPLIPSPHNCCFVSFLCVCQILSTLYEVRWLSGFLEYRNGALNL